MGKEHGSRLVPITTGIVEIAVGYFLAGIGKGVVFYLTLIAGGGLVLLGLKALLLGVFAKQEKIDEMTLKKIR